MTKREITGHADEDKGDGHEGTVGIERPGDNSNKKKQHDDAGLGSEFQGFVFWRIPVKEDLAVLRGKGVRVARRLRHRYWLRSLVYFSTVVKRMMCIHRVMLITKRSE